MRVTLLRMTENPFDLISKAYRICYHSMPYNKEKEKEFIKNCIAREHTSPIEHCSATFLVEGISRPTSQQLERHRIASYTQESQRYVDAKSATFLIPESVFKNKNLLLQYKHALRVSYVVYNNLIEGKIKKEDARFILPQAVETSLIFTMNFRSLRNFLKLRLDTNAQWEIRELAAEVYRQMFNKDRDIKVFFGDIWEKYLDFEKGVDKMKKIL